jgi:hypothetical protein
VVLLSPYFEYDDIGTDHQFTAWAISIDGDFYQAGFGSLTTAKAAAFYFIDTNLF